MANTITISRQKALEQAAIAHGGGSADGSIHEGDELVKDLLLQSLASSNRASRMQRAGDRKALDLWDDSAEKRLAAQVDAAAKTERQRRQALVDSGERSGLVDAFYEESDLQIADMYTPERVQNAKTEVLSRYVISMIMPETPILNNFFTRISGQVAGNPSRLQEDVTYFEAISDWPYHPIDPNRGRIRSIEINIEQANYRVNKVDAMYGAMLEYEDYRNRVLENASLGEIFSILAMGWAKASARQRERDASTFLTDTIKPHTVFNNNAGGTSALGQTTGVGLNAQPNGTFNFDFDFPLLQDYMLTELNMDTSNLVMLLPRNAWSFLNTKKGYKQFLGTDGEGLYQRPQISKPSPQNGFPENDFGVQYKGTGPRSAAAGADNYGRLRKEQGGLTNRLIPGEYHLLPSAVPNWGAEFMLPNSAFGPMRVVLTPYQKAQHKVFPDGHPNANDPITGAKRPVMATDILLFDGNRPLYMIDTIPPTSWGATEDLHRTSAIVMVEGWTLAATARGQQAVSLEGMVADHDYRPEMNVSINVNAADVAATNSPLDTGLESA